MEIKQYWNIIKKRLWLILACVLVATLTTWYYTEHYVTPMYEASGKLVVNKTTISNAQVQMDVSAIYSSIQLINTYREIILSSAIADKVVSEYPDLNTNSSDLLEKTSVESLSNTQIMIVKVKDANYDWAAKAANAIAVVFQREVPNLLKINNVSVLTEAPLGVKASPINDNMKQNVIISFALSLLFSIGVTFLWEYLDTTLKTEEDIMDLFDVPVLTVIAKLKRKDFISKEHRKNKSLQAGEAQYAAANQ